MKEGYKLKEVIILDGLIGYCDTHDEQNRVIGVKHMKRVKRLNGEILETEVSSFPFTKEMEEKCGWRKSYANIQMLVGDTPIEIDKIEETKIVSMEGDVDSYYYHRYSDYTGYLWTEEGFKVGGHDIPNILEGYIGQYIYMEIELYNKQ